MSKKALKAALKIKDGELSSIPRRALKGEKTREENEALSMLTAWHNNAKKKKDFAGVLR
ncbi:MAG: hypothetical protein Q8N09_04135 [Thermodesulfovibrionia bacterium]|nr:hypothetical protein [Thermodesulfovibrionia bacterium]